MPLATPLEEEKEREFISRCMADADMKEEFEDIDQRLAVCYTQWDEPAEEEPEEEEPEEEPIEDEEELIRSTIPIVKQGATENRTMSFVISNEDLDRDGDIIMQSGWDLTAFKANPVFMAIHDRSRFPIGKFLDIEVKDNTLVGTVKFADEGIYDVADLAWDLYQQDIMKAVSVGFRPVPPWDDNVTENDSGGFTYSKQELLEVSAVPVPANPKALAISKGYKNNTAEMLIKLSEQPDKAEQDEVNAETEEANVEDINKVIEAIRGLNNAIRGN